MIETQHGKDQDQNSDEYMRAIVHILGPVNVQVCSEACTVRNITLENFKVHGGSWNGIYGGAGYYQLDTKTYGYIDNLVIQNVESWNNHKSGVDVTSTYTKTITYASTNIKVLDSYLHHNGADGVVLGPVDHGLIDGNDCSYNGQNRNARLGCWGWYTLKVETEGSRITIWFDGEKELEATDRTFMRSGMIGFITHADSVALFDDLSIQAGNSK